MWGNLNDVLTGSEAIGILKQLSATLLRIDAWHISSDT